VTQVRKSGPSVRYRGGQGEPLLLLHGFALCADAWRRVLPGLERHHEVFAVTFPGHMGGLPLPQDFQHSIRASADLAETELDASGFDKVHVVGNSLGGWLAVELGRRGRALSVVAISPGGGWVPGSPEHRRLKSVFKRFRRLLRIGGPLASHVARFGASRRLALGEIVAHPERLTPSEARLLIEAPWRCDAFDGVLDALAHEPPPEPLPSHSYPIRLVWGNHDQLLPIRGYSELWRKILPEAEWVELPGAGHVPMYDDPDAVVRSIVEVTTRQVAPDASARGHRP
jgi:pimeloyl-ACP methyl ester carboxylesterase